MVARNLVPGVGIVVGHARTAFQVPGANSFTSPVNVAIGAATAAAFAVPPLLGRAARANTAYDLENSPEGADVTQTLERLLAGLPNKKDRDAAQKYLARNWDSLCSTVFELRSPDLTTSWRAASSLARDVNLNAVLGFETKQFNDTDKGRALEILGELGGNRLLGADGRNEVLTNQEYQRATEQFNAANDAFRSPAAVLWAAHSPNRGGLPELPSDTDSAVLLVVATLTRIGVHAKRYMHVLPAALSTLDGHDGL